MFETNATKLGGRRDGDRPPSAGEGLVLVFAAQHSFKARWRWLIAITVGAVLAAPTAALAATNGARPVLPNWGVRTSCGAAYPTLNCGQVRATAENRQTHTLYVAGDFSAAIDHTGTFSLPYSDLVALRESTGTVVSTFRPHRFNGLIDAVAVDQARNRVYVGGAFTTVDGSGLHAQHAAAFDATTGKLLAFDLHADRPVLALLPAGPMLYVGGQFGALGRTVRGSLAAVDPTTGSALAGFVPPAIRWSGTNRPDVRTLALGADAHAAPALYVGGHFDMVNGAAHQSVIRVNPTTGELDTSFAPVIDAVPGDPLQAADGIAWVSGSEGGSPGVVIAQAGHFNRAYRFDTAGRRSWFLTPDGDVQAVALAGTTVYIGGHFRCVSTAPAYCSLGAGVTRVHIAAVDLATGAVETDFTPRMDPSSAPDFFGVWSLEITSDGTLWAGGVFADVTVGGKTYKRPKLAAFPPL